MCRAGPQPSGRRTAWAPATTCSCWPTSGPPGPRLSDREPFWVISYTPVTTKLLRTLSPAGGDEGSELIGLRDEVGSLDSGGAMAYLIEETHGPPVVVVGPSPPEDLSVGQTDKGEQAVTPEPGQHLVAFFEQRHGLVEVAGGRCTHREIEADRPEDRAVGMRPVVPVGAERRAIRAAS